MWTWLFCGWIQYLMYCRFNFFFHRTIFTTIKNLLKSTNLYKTKNAVLEVISDSFSFFLWNHVPSHYWLFFVKNNNDAVLSFSAQNKSIYWDHWNVVWIPLSKISSSQRVNEIHRKCVWDGLNFDVLALLLTVFRDRTSKIK